MNKTSFLHELIQGLIDRDIINQAITIPYMLGAYKIKDCDSSPVTEEYLNSVLQEVISCEESEFYIYTCDNIVKDLVISIVNKEYDKDLYNSLKYPYVANADGKPRIFFENNFPISPMSIEHISIYFWKLYTEQLNQCLYSYDYDTDLWGAISDREREIIKEISKKYNS